MTSYLFLSKGTSHLDFSFKDRIAWTQLYDLRQTTNNVGNIS